MNRSTSNNTEKYKKRDYRKIANPFNIYNERWDPMDICEGSEMYEANEDSNIYFKNGELAFTMSAGNYISNSDKFGFMYNEQLTPFELLVAIRYNGDYRSAICFVEYSVMNFDVPYLRVGTNFFKKIQKENRWGITTTELKVWNKDTIKDDFGKSFLRRCHNFDDFTIVPDNRNYRSVVNGMYNLYEPFPHQPFHQSVTIQDFPNIHFFMKHIFGEQIEIGYKYMKILYENPCQQLPVLVLVSKERQTGKTSWLNFMDILFANNFTILPPEDLNSQFNSQYAYRNIIGIDEAVIDRASAVEKIKSLATAHTILVNQKMVAQYRIPFYGKIIITTNKEVDFMRIDSEEIRFWVRKIGSIDKSRMTNTFYDDLIKEIPMFLKHLIENVSVQYGKSRMVFTYEEIHNKYIEQVKVDSRSNVHKDILILIREAFEANQQKENIYLRVSDIKNRFFDNNARITTSYITKVLRDEMNMTPEPMARYAMLDMDKQIAGTPYKFTRSEFAPNSLIENSSPF
jgi:hypothetical protein